MFGSPTADILDGTRIPAAHHALVFGFGGNDMITPPDGHYDLLILAGEGDDVVSPPVVDGDFGEFVLGGAGADTLSGSGGDDWLAGGLGNDTLTGGSGQDELQGGAGGDTLNACPYDREGDVLYGNDGRDQFQAAFPYGIPQDDLHDLEERELVLDCKGAQLP